MEGSASQHFNNQNKGLRVEPLNFNGDQILGVPKNVMNADVIQEVQNLALKDSMNGNGGPVERKDCNFFMRYGWCKFGSNCRYNHPVDRRSQVNKEITKPQQENLHRMEQVECKYYLKPEGCKHGRACRYNHNGRKTVVAPVLEFNFLGLPIRPGEKECPYYMRDGSCKFGVNCWFDHPHPSSVGGGFPFYGYNGLEESVPCWSLAVPVNEMAPFEPHVYQPAQCAPYSQWNGYQVPNLEQHEAPAKSTPPEISMNTPAPAVKSYPQHQQRELVKESSKPNEQPERNFKVGFGSQYPKTPSCPLNVKGLPLRPDFEVCALYGQYGVCKHGTACKFDHPLTEANSVPAAAGSEEAQTEEQLPVPDPTSTEDKS